MHIDRSIMPGSGYLILNRVSRRERLASRRVIMIGNSRTSNKAVLSSLATLVRDVASISIYRDLFLSKADRETLCHCLHNNSVILSE